MHIDAVGALVDLGSTNLHKLAEAWFKTGSNGDGCAVPLLHEGRGGGKGIQLGGMSSLLLLLLPP